MKRGYDGSWLLVTLILWAPCALLLNLGAAWEFSTSLKTETEYAREVFAYDLTRVRGAVSPASRLELIWRGVRGRRATTGTAMSWRGEAVADLARQGLPGAHLFLLHPRTGTVLPVGEDGRVLSKLLGILASRQQDLLENDGTVVRTSFVAFFHHLFARSYGVDCFSLLPLPGQQWWFAGGWARFQGEPYFYGLFVDLDRGGPGDRARADAAWLDQIRPRLVCRADWYADDQADGQTVGQGRQGTEGLTVVERTEESWRGSGPWRHACGIRLDRGWLVMSLPATATRIWRLGLFLVAIAAFSLAWLVGSWRDSGPPEAPAEVSPMPAPSWSGGDLRASLAPILPGGAPAGVPGAGSPIGAGDGAVRLQATIRLRLGLAVGLSVMGFLLAAEGQMVGRASRLLFEGWQRTSADLEGVEGALEVFQAQVEEQTVAFLKEVPSIPTASEGRRWALDLLSGEILFSNIHIFASSGIYLSPVHHQTKPGFFVLAQLPERFRRSFLRALGRKGERWMEYYRDLFQACRDRGRPLTLAEAREFLRSHPRDMKPAANFKAWEKTLGSIAKDVCQSLNAPLDRAGGLEGGAVTQGGPMGFMAAVAGLEQEDMVKESIADLGKVKRYNVGKETMFSFGKILYDRVGRAQNLLIAYWRAEVFTFPFVSRFVHRARARGEAAGWYFFCSDFDSLDFVSRRVPGDTRLVAESVAWVGEVKRYIAQLPGGEWHLFQFQRSRLMDHLVLGHSIPLSELNADLVGLQRSFRWGLVLALVCLLAGFQVLRTYLVHPVDDLEVAVATLSHAREALPPIRDPVGELHSLAGLFGQVKGSLAQLDLGRVIQETLLPASEGSCGSLRFVGRSVMMEQVGGDFFDFVRDPRNPDWIYICIGDVTGHGLGSAIVVSMLSGAVRVMMQTEVTGAEAIMAALNPPLVRILKRVRMATFQIVRVNGKTGEFEMATAAHQPLVIVKPDGSRESVELPAPPLGFRDKAKFGRQGGTVLPGGWLILNTDGCVEAAKSGGGDVGYEGFAAMAGKVVGEGFDGALDRFFREFSTVTGARAWQDDVTLVIVSFGARDPGNRGTKG